MVIVLFLQCEDKPNCAKHVGDPETVTQAILQTYGFNLTSKINFTRELDNWERSNDPGGRNLRQWKL